jgi:hypothetical protein
MSAAGRAGGRTPRGAVGRHALAEPRHVIETHVRRTGHYDDDAEHQREHPVKLAGVRRGESSINDELEALADGEHRAGSDDEADRREHHLAAIWAQESTHARDRLQRGHRRNLGGRFQAGIGAGHRNGKM